MPAPTDALTLARKYHQSGNLSQALGLYQRLLQQNPNHAEVLHGFGLALHQAGQGRQGVEYMARAVALRPLVAEYPHSLGLALCDLGQVELAQQYFRTALQVNPKFVEAHLSLGQVAVAIGNHEEAITAFKNVLKRKPQSAEAHHALGTALQSTGNLTEAISHLQKAVKFQPSWAEAQYNLGVALLEETKASEATIYFRKALKLNPNWPEAHNNLGQALERQEKTTEALEAYRQALALQPDFIGACQNLGKLLIEQENFTEAIPLLQRVLQRDPEAWEIALILGCSLQEQKQITEAVSCFEKVLKVQSDNTTALHNLSGCLRDLGQLEEAMEYGRRVLEIKPDMPGGHYNWGIFLQDQNRITEAIACFDQTIELDPDYAQAYFNRGTAHLFLGDFAEGWPGYEWRWKLEKLFKIVRPDLGKLRWDGSSLSGKTIIIETEQGFGDNMQFVRYANLLKAQGAKVLLICRPPLKELLSTCLGVDQVLGEGDHYPDFDVYIPIVSLPLMLETRLESIPNQVPYLKAPDRRPRPHEEALFIPTPKVGILWKGHVNFIDDARRHCQLKDLEPLFEIPGITFFSLYRGDNYQELAPYPDLVNVGSYFRDFNDSAYAIDKLDLIITIDTSVAHLAGALAKLTWTMLRFVPDWRWLQERPDSPWYPTMRLFRQPKAGDWTTVVNQVREALQEWVTNRPQPPAPPPQAG